MKRYFFVGLVVILLVGGGFVVWKKGATIKTRLHRTVQEARLPEAEVFIVPTSTMINPVPGIVTGTRVVPGTIPGTKDPLAWDGPLPEEKNLAVPFLSQAPKKNWDEPYQEACEEASSIMVDAYYDGRRTDFAPEEGDEAILELIDVEKRLFGFYEDTTAEQTGRLIKEHFGYSRILVKQVYDMDVVKRALANGYPVIIPASGKMLANPHFRNGGPLYHMLVVKGYTKEGKWITNDPGTQFGKSFTYTTENLFDSIHDWNDGDVLNGKKVILIVLPNA